MKPQKKTVLNILIKIKSLDKLKHKERLIPFHLGNWFNYKYISDLPRTMATNAFNFDSIWKKFTKKQISSNEMVFFIVK